MIEPGSLIGFALVFVATAWATSALLAGSLWLARDRLRRAGPRAERRAASIALALPVALGVLLTTGLAGFSVLGPAFGFADHCPEHPHHLHLCLRHGGEWAAQWWAVALTAGLAGWYAVRVARAAHDWWFATRHLRALRAVSSTRVLPGGAEVVCAPSRQPFCFTAGVRAPRIYVGSVTLEQLGPEQQRAMLAHERAHVALGDLWRGGALSTLALLGAPGVAASALRLWRDAAERLCDRAAADAVGSPEAVASAILAFSRAPACAIGFAFVPHPAQIVDRVEAVLGDAPRGDRAARRLGALAVSTIAAAAAAAVLLVDPLHHAAETLLGSL